MAYATNIPEVWVPTRCDKCDALIFDRYDSLPNIVKPGDLWCVSCVDTLMADKGWVVDEAEGEMA